MLESVQLREPMILLHGDKHDSTLETTAIKRVRTFLVQRSTNKLPTINQKVIFLRAGSSPALPHLHEKDFEQNPRRDRLEAAGC